MTELRILAAAAYNRISTIEEQQCKCLPFDILKAIGRLFVVAGLEGDYGLGILHRHFEIPADTIMLHCKDRDLYDMCEVRSLSKIPLSSIRAHSLFLNEANEFQAFEYDLESTRQQVDEEFLNELRDFFVQHGLTSLLAVVANPTADEELFEFQLPDNSGMINVPRSMAENAIMANDTSTTTGWAFRERSGVIEVHSTRECDPQPSGFHKKIITKDIDKKPLNKARP